MKKVIQKAWKINADNFSQPWHVEHLLFYAETRNEARTEALKEIMWEGHQDKSGEEIGLLNIKIVRAYGADKVEYDGKIMTVGDMAYEVRKKAIHAELDKLAEENPNSFCYIIKRGAYYRPNHCGYTNNKFSAGIYPIKEAVKTVKGCDIDDNMQAVVVQPEEHNSEVHRQIKELETDIEKLKQNLITV